MYSKILLFHCVFLFNCTQVFAQEKVKISGGIKSEETKSPVSFAHISLEGSNYGTVADEEGRFLMYIPIQEDIQLQISAIGYQSKTIFFEGENIDLLLKPSAIMLKEMDIVANTLAPEAIVKKAFKNIKKNYIKEPVLLKTFYRHTCKDNDKYCRMIDAQINVYKKKGYGKIEQYEHNKDKFEVNELRRSFDQSNMMKGWHSPMALDVVLKGDIAALKQHSGSKKKIISLLKGFENFVNTRKKYFDFKWEGLIEMDGSEVYKIGYQMLSTSDHKSNKIEDVVYSGYFYINSTDFAILKFESTASSNDLYTKVDQVVTYRKYNGKYGLFHSRCVISSFHKDCNGHTTNIDLMVNHIEFGRQKNINQTNITRNYLASIPYNKSFWSQYAPRLDASISDSLAWDLKTDLTLTDQFEKMSALEEGIAKDILKQENKLDSLIANIDSILVIDLWASWCRPCMLEFHKSKFNREKFSASGVKFLMVSIDEDVDSWRNAILNFMMDKEEHIRIGPHSEFLEQLEMDKIPRFLIYHKQLLINDDAPLPHTELFVDLMENLISGKEN
ncbi:carboxypeptidase-like regulatory domain-containing protein [Flexithrix dorotheae]|uniref:carboxypeptidase-like regulatory domain-containing protein n=1 Tax=Flexithrix dorotheae TaxID=70993 RepID=UPI0003770604|nr:carboxypeptidase-like regulatory domain-containing protein [Flexithrix dorotheae]